jgi:methionyl-tRNA formyltransferase
MVKELDAGDIIAQESTVIAESETALEVRPRLIRVGAELLARTLPKYLNNEIEPVVQDSSLATRAYKIKKEDGLLDLNAPAEENWHKYRAYADSIGTYFFEDGKRMKITNAEFASGKFRVLRVIPEGKREISFADFSQKN